MNAFFKQTIDESRAGSEVERVAEESECIAEGKESDILDPISDGICSIAALEIEANEEVNLETLGQDGDNQPSQPCDSGQDLVQRKPPVELQKTDSSFSTIIEAIYQNIKKASLIS